MPDIKPMLAHDLAAWLFAQDNKPVYMETEEMIAPLIRVDTDAFDSEEGLVVVLIADLTD